jgi:hypothetical protein
MLKVRFKNALIKNKIKKLIKEIDNIDNRIKEIYSRNIQNEIKLNLVKILKNDKEILLKLISDLVKKEFGKVPVIEKKFYETLIKPYYNELEFIALVNDMKNNKINYINDFVYHIDAISWSYEFDKIKYKLNRLKIVNFSDEYKLFLKNGIINKLNKKYAYFNFNYKKIMNMVCEEELKRLILNLYVIMDDIVNKDYRDVIFTFIYDNNFKYIEDLVLFHFDNLIKIKKEFNKNIIFVKFN